MKLSSGFTKGDFFALIGITCLFANSITLYYTFLKAFFNGHQTLVTINTFNEASFEFLFLPVTLMLGLFGLIRFFKKIKNRCPECKCEMIYRFGYGYWCPDCHYRIHAGCEFITMMQQYEKKQE